MTLNGPSVWQPLADQVRTIWPDAIVAGGACRDFVVDPSIEPRDIDFFVEASDELEFELKLFDLKAMFAGVKSKSTNDMSAYIVGEDADLGPDQQIVGVYEFWSNAPDLKLNVIGKRPGAMTSLDALFATFDHSLCDFAWVPGNDVYRSAEADATLRTRKIYKRLDRGVRTTERLNELCRRQGYRDFTFDGQIKLDIRSKSVKMSYFDEFAPIEPGYIFQRAFIDVPERFMPDGPPLGYHEWLADRQVWRIEQ